MDLMTLAAKLTLDDSGFKSGMSSAESLGQQFTNKMSAMTVAAGQYMYDVAKRAVSTLTGMFGSAVDSYADYQQLIGGIETLFKSSSDKVAAYAKQSFKTTGLSANDYMETVTSFSASLLQGLKGDTEAAADLANTAVQDMADNANKMGTDLSSIQTAYQGFAKQNYTMLDNLKLGYGGTKEEMVRLVNDSGILDHKIKDLNGITFDQLVEAIHAIQTQLGITGTTAKEAADTISGSKASLKASWEDLMSAVGGEGDQDRLDQTIVNFQDSFEAYMRNFIPTLTTTIMNSGTLVEGLAGALERLPKSTLNTLINAGLTAGADMFEGLQVVTDWLMDSVVTFFRESSLDPSRIADFGHALGEFVGDAVENFIKNFPEIVTGMLNVGITLAGSIVSGIWDGLFGNNDGVQKVFDEADKTMIDSIKGAEEQSVKAEGIINYLDNLAQKYGESATNTEEWAKALGDLEKIMPGATKYITEQNGPLENTLKNLQGIREELRQQAIENAKRKALETKETAYYDLLAEVGVKQTDIDIARQNKQAAGEHLTEWFNQVYADNGVAWKKFDPEEWANNRKGLREEAVRLLDFYAKDSEGNAYEKDSEEYNVMKAQLLGWADSLTGTDDEIETMQKDLDELNKQLAFAEAEYKKTSEALDALMKSADSASGTLSQITLPKMGNMGPLRLFQPENPMPAFMPRAVGIDDVPFDGFRTELHRGEAVLTKEENDARRRAMDYGEMEAALENAVRAGMSGMYFNMNGNKVADLTSRQTGRNLSTSERSAVRAMGG